MQTPTETELRAVDEQLRAVGYSHATRDAIRLKNLSYYRRNDQLDAITENCTALLSEDGPEVSVDELMTAAGLTDRQQLVIKWRLEGETVRKIGVRLDCAFKTAHRDLQAACDLMSDEAIKYKWYGLRAILASLDTRKSNWPDPDLA